MTRDIKSINEPAAETTPHRLSSINEPQVVESVVEEETAQAEGDYRPRRRTSPPKRK